MKTIWNQTVSFPEKPHFSGDCTTDAVVIGAGMAGILTAYFLQETGISTIVLEADRIGSGQTGRTSAKITSQHNLIYDKLIRQFGEQKAKQYATANQQAIEEYRKLISTLSIECEFTDCPAYLYSTAQEEILKKELEAARKLEIDAYFTTRTTLPFPVTGALKFTGQAQFHPLKFLAAIAANLTIYEQTRALDVCGNQVLTDQGTITAKHIIFATHYPFINAPGYYFLRMHQERSYLLALKQAAELDGMYLSIDEDGSSLRNFKDLTLLGGGRHRTGNFPDSSRYEMLHQTAAALFPDSQETLCWSAQDCMTLDGVPYIGRFSSAIPDWYVATGFGKWGMTGSMTAAHIIKNMITGLENPNAEIFSPQRFALTASAKNLAEDALNTVTGFTRKLLSAPQAGSDEIPVGHGAIIEYEGQKLGVYKDTDGQLFTVSTRCPHLGCQLEWNPDEKSWDCPCHGSRFDYKGNLIDNPAQEDLPHA